MSIKQKIGGALALGSLAAGVLLPASSFAATNVTVSDNGAFSHNGVAVIKAKLSKVKQKNTTVANTFVASSSNTGGNKIKFNVGGTNSITTGNTSTNVGVVVAGGTNTNTNGCGCPTGDTDVEISGNGAFSHNGVLVVDVDKSVVKQSNTTVVNTVVLSSSDTGNNSSSFNVGGGNTTDTGDTSTSVGVVVTGSSNTNN